ncbi:MAG: TIGR00730 family Rossman fold protein, partial [Alphaproteobacteria bacterium]
GLMGIMARAALEAGGHVIGIIPHHLERLEVALHSISELMLVDTMHERKAMMFSRADVFVVLPGGVGTLDEFVEMTTWAQLGLHAKPILLVNLNGYFRALLAHFDRLVHEGFADPETLTLFEVLPDMPALWARLEGIAVSAPERQ